MGKIRFNLLGIFMVAMGAIATLTMGITYFEGWERWACAGGIAVTSIFALALTVVLGMSLLTTTGDLWDTWWFRRMRKFWGVNFGGPESVTDPETGEKTLRTLQISLCKAVNLSAMAILTVILCYACMSILALVMVSFIIAGAGTVMYLAGVGAWSGIATPSNFLFVADSSLGKNITGFLIIGGVLIQSVVYFIWAIAIKWIALEILKPSKEHQQMVWNGFLSILIGTSILIFLVAPMRTIGLEPFLVWIGIVLGGIAGLVLAVILLVLSIWGIIRGSRKLSGETVAGVLLRSRIRAWKRKLCPSIVQGENFSI